MPGDSDIVEEEKHRAEGLVRILPARQRRATAQEAMLPLHVIGAWREPEKFPVRSVRSQIAVERRDVGQAIFWSFRHRHSACIAA